MTPTVRDLARQAVLQEAGDRREPEALAEAAERACARLRDRLADLIGINGFWALLARALRLAKAEVPALAGITVDAQTEGGLRGMRAFASASACDPAILAVSLAAILGHLIWLLITFIGEDLAMRLVREAWPELSDAVVGLEVRP